MIQKFKHYDKDKVKKSFITKNFINYDYDFNSNSKMNLIMELFQLLSDLVYS